MSAKEQWLHEQIAQWAQEGLVSRSAAETLTARYPVPGESTTHWFKHLITALGALIFGLGVILAFAYNWADMPKWAKLGVIFSGILISYLMAAFVDSRHSVIDNAHSMLPWFRRSLSATGEGFYLIGAMLYGAGIFLIAQIYHMDEHYPTAFLIWGCAPLVLAWLLPSVFQGLLALALFSCWGASEFFDFSRTLWTVPLLIGAGIVSFAWFRQSRFLFAVSLVSATLFLISNIFKFIDSYSSIPVILIVAFLFILIARATRNAEFIAGKRLLQYFGCMLYAGVLVAITYIAPHVEDEFSHTDITNDTLHVSLCWAAVALAGLLLLSQFFSSSPNKHANEHRLFAIAHSAIVFCCTLLTTLTLSNVSVIPVSWLSWAVTIGLFAHSLLLIIAGNQIPKRSYLAAGALTIIVIVTGRFFDLFDSLIARAAVFLFVGAMLFYLGYRINKIGNRRGVSASQPRDNSQQETTHA